MIVSNSEKVGLKEFQYNNDKPVLESTSQDGRFIWFHHLACRIIFRFIFFFSHHQESEPSPYSSREREKERERERERGREKDRAKKQINNNKNV
jgi:hypothetical protein